MKTVRVLTALAVVAVVLAVAPQSFAAQITITSNPFPGEYLYSLELATGESPVTFLQGDQIVLSGLSGVDVKGGGVSDGLGVCFDQTTLTQSSFAAMVVSPGSGCTTLPGPQLLGTLEVISSVLTLGTINWDIVSTTGTVSGTTLGPVAATPVSVPEPAGLVLLGTALLGLVGLARRKGSR